MEKILKIIWVQIIMYRVDIYVRICWGSSMERCISSSPLLLKPRSWGFLMHLPLWKISFPKRVKESLLQYSGFKVVFGIVLVCSRVKGFLEHRTFIFKTRIVLIKLGGVGHWTTSKWRTSQVLGAISVTWLLKYMDILFWNIPSGSWWSGCQPETDF